MGDEGQATSGMPVEVAELVIVRHGESVGNLAAAAAGEQGLARRELDYRDPGPSDGMTGQGTCDTYPEKAKRREAMGKFYYRPPGGESWTDVVLRVRGDGDWGSGTLSTLPSPPKVVLLQAKMRLRILVRLAESR